MSTKIGVVSDVHASPEPLAHAIDIFQRENVDHIFCAGDIAGYGDELEKTVELLKAHRCQSIYGNHDLWYLDSASADPNSISYKFLSGLAPIFDLTIEHQRLFMVHAHPPDSNRGGIKLLGVDGMVIESSKNFWSKTLAGDAIDVLIIGHTHQVFSHYLGNTLAINPGSSCFNNSCAIVTLPSKKVEFFALCGKTISPVWNWGQYMQNQ